MTLGAAAALGTNAHLSPEQEEAIRRRLPERDRNGFLRISEIKPDGSFTYSNLNYNLPQSIAIEGAVAAARGNTPAEAASNFAQSMAQQFFGANLVYGPATDVIRNRTETGRKVRSPNDPLTKQLTDSTAYLAKEMLMPLAVNEVQKAINLGKERATEAGIKYTAGDLALANLAGVRIYRKDLDETFRGDASRLVSRR